MTALLFLLALLGLFGLGTGAGSEEASESASWGSICEPASNVEPCTSAEIGVGYPVAIESHCEIASVYFDGRYWIPDSGGPVSSGGSDVVTGLMLMPTKAEALFEGDEGVDVTFVPAPADYVPPPCA